jgi:3-(3-hydroxy-phenyl)propionate hydroxylase
MVVTGDQHIIVAGAGPVGAVFALAAARAGFKVSIFEADPVVNDTPKASTTHPSTLEMLDTLGIMDEYIAQGLVARYFDYWDKPRRALVARMDHQILKDDTKFPFVVQTEQHKLANMALRKLSQMGNVDVHMASAITAIEQGADSVTVDVTCNGAVERYTGDWLVGCDGAHSVVRKSLGTEFKGYTWPESFVVITSLYEFGDVVGCSERAYFADPAGWTNLFKVAGDDLKGRWRSVFPTREDETDEQALNDDAVVRRLSTLWIEPSVDRVVDRKVYRVHQRVAENFRGGRCFVAGDAAHLNNPIGGLGLNGGIHDAFELVDTLKTAREHGPDDDLLDRYHRRRHDLTVRFVQEQTINNKRRLEEKDPEKRAQRLNDLRDIADDPARHRAFLRRTSLLDSVDDAKSIA